MTRRKYAVAKSEPIDTKKCSRCAKPLDGASYLWLNKSGLCESCRNSLRAEYKAAESKR